MLNWSELYQRKVLEILEIHSTRGEKKIDLKLNQLKALINVDELVSLTEVEGKT